MNSYHNIHFYQDSSNLILTGKLNQHVAGMEGNPAKKNHTLQPPGSSISTVTYTASGRGSETAMFLDMGSSIPSPSSANLEDLTAMSEATDPTQPGREIRRRHHILTLGMKLKIINDIEQGVKRTHIQKQYKLPSSTLSTILSHKEDIKKCVGNSDYCPQRRRVRKSKYHEMEEMLWEWYKETSAQPGGEVLTNTKICNKALELASQLGMSDFKANGGWVCRFRQRRGIYRSPAAKLAKVKPQAPANPDLIEHWTTAILPDIMKKYNPNDIFIAHETGLFFRCTPDTMLPLVGERCTGGKLAKERLTVMLVCNMSGSEKLPLLVVGRYARPRSLKYVKTVPTEYVSNKKVWMLPMFFEEWVKKFDSLMENSWRRVALFVTPCGSHTHVEDLKSVSLVFLPPDLNLQPGNQGIVQDLKLNYRCIVLEKFLDEIEQRGPMTKLSISVMDAMLWLRESWNAVTPEHITSSFKKAGFQVREQSQRFDSDISPNELRNHPFYTAFEKLCSAIALDPLVTAESYLTIDSHLFSMGTMSTCEMMVARAAMKHADEEDADDQDEEPETKPSVTEARQSINNLLRFFEHVKGDQESFKHISEMERFIHKLTSSPVKQTTMLDYFMRRSNKTSRVPKPRHSYFFPRS